MPDVRRYVTRCPPTLAPRDPVSHAHRVMQEHRCRHVPVVDGGSLVGIVTDRDLLVLQGMRAVEPDHVLVEQIMSKMPVAVPGETGLDKVLELMSAKRVDAIVVIDQGCVVGLVTAVDALHALADALGCNAG